MTQLDRTDTVGTTESDQRRPLLRPDAYLARFEDGLYLLTHDGGSALPGASLPDWVEGLTPFLTGQHTRDEITGALAPERRRVVEQVLDALAARGALREVGRRRPGRLTAVEQRLYRHELDYLGYFLDSPERAFLRYRTCRLLVVGAGSLLPAMAGAALRSGLRTVRIQPTADDPTDLDALRDEVDAELARDPDRTVHGVESVPLPAPETPARSPESWEHTLERAVADADLVLYVADRAAPALSRLLERCCADNGIPFTQAMRDGVNGNEVWHVGPGKSLSSGWRRLAGQRTAQDGHRGRDERERRDQDRSPTANPGATPNTGTAVVADQVLHRLFRQVTGVEAESGAPNGGANAWGGNGHGSGTSDHRTQMMVVRTDTLSGHAHAFVRHPFHAPARASSGPEFLAGVAAVRGAARLDAEEFSRRAVKLMDDRVGIFTEIDECDFAQLPLHVARTVVADPIGLLGEGALPEVTGSGLDFEAARHRTALRALATYGSLLVDPRRLCDGDGAPLLPAGSDPDESLARLRTGPADSDEPTDESGPGSRIRGWVRGVDAANGKAVLLPAEQVFPVLRTAVGSGQPDDHGVTRAATRAGTRAGADFGTGAGYRMPVGTSAAYSWPEAWLGGLLQHCERLTVDEAIGSGRRFGTVDVTPFTGDSTVAYYQAMLAAITTSDEPVTVHDITGSLGVPTAACAIAGVPLTYASGASWPEAIAESHRRLLLLRQASLDGGAAYGPEPASALSPMLLGAGPPRTPRLDRPLRLDDLVGALTRHRHAVAAVPLDHDPEVHAVLPFVLRMVVTDAS